MRIIHVLRCLGVGLVAAAACGGESSRSGDEPSGEAGAAPTEAEGGAAGSSSGTAAGDSSGAGEGGATASGGNTASGGKATGGAATGGVATGGVATGGMPNLDPILIPEGCEADNAMQGSGSCSVGFTCNQVYLSVFCNEGAGDAWKCYCKGNVEGTYDVRAENSGAACAVASAFCSGRGPDLGELPEDCQPTEKVDAQSCSRQLHCEHTIELEEGTAVLVEETSEVSCSDSGVEGSVSCSCAGGDDAMQYDSLLDTSIEEACGPALSLCRSKQRKPAGLRECEPESLSASDGNCSLTQGCKQPLELDDGTVVSVYSPDFASCVTITGNQSRCDCGGYEGTFSFDVDTPTTIATCTEAGEICARRYEIEPGGDVTCTAQNQSVVGRVCNTELNCSRSGTLGDLEIAQQAIVQVQCSEGDTGWDCSCTSGSNSVAVAGVEAADAWDACSAAAEACPETTGVF